MSGKTALVTGVTGQDGSYLAELLLQRGYHVVGAVRRSASPNHWRIAHLHDLELADMDLNDSSSISRLIDRVRPQEIYNLAAQSYVAVSWDTPLLTADVTALGPLRILEAIRQIDPSIRFYQASSSEMFGSTLPPQNEKSLFHPRSPYGVAKVFAHHTTVNYRESYGMFACSGILFNHEGPRRGEEFVTRKISKAVARIKLGLQKDLRLGNLNARRDWGLASEYVEAMYQMLQRSQPDDFVIATGRSNSVRQFVQAAFSAASLNWQDYVVDDPTMVRPAEVESLIGDAAKAAGGLQWQPKLQAMQLAVMMVEYDIFRQRTGRLDSIDHPY